MANLVSSSLYERRFGPFFVSPVVAGIDQKSGKPFICGFDSIGCIDFAKDFIVSGTASDQLFGTCEGLWEPDLVSGGQTAVWMRALTLSWVRDRKIYSRRFRRRC